MTQITINLPDNLVESAQILGTATARDLSQVLVDTLEVILPTFTNLSEISNNSEMSNLLDKEVVELANLKMDAVQNKRLAELQTKGKNMGLTEAESYELSVLITIYQIGQLKKSKALAEAVKRGLKKSLLP